MNGNQETDRLTPELLQLRAGQTALWHASRKYLGVICASILAIVLARPEMARETQILGYALNRIVEAYLVIGVFGVFLAEIVGAAAKELNTAEPAYPMWMKKLFALYALVGIAIFSRLLHEVMA